MKSFKIFGCSTAIFVMGASIATAKDTASVSIDVRASVPMTCEVSNRKEFSQIGPDSFVIGSLSRFCNTAHDIYVGHGANTPVAEIAIGEESTALNSQLSLVVSNSAPASGTEQIILTGVDSETAKLISASLTAQISPSGL